jgi:flagellar biosynthesis/type III secretory pathway chaperone
MISIANDRTFQKLVECLEKQVRVYRHLLDIVRLEKDYIMKADMTNLAEGNKAKEAMLPNLRNLERSRIKLCSDLARNMGLALEEPRLLDFAAKADMPSADRLRSIHSTLELLIKRIQKKNQENERLINVSMETVKGSIEAVTKSLADKSNYAKEGKVKETKPAGRFVSKQA